MGIVSTSWRRIHMDVENYGDSRYIILAKGIVSRT